MSIIDFDPTELDFENIHIGQQKSQKILIHNRTTELGVNFKFKRPINVTLQPSEGFLEKNGAAFITIVVAPRSCGNFNTKLTLITLHKIKVGASMHTFTVGEFSIDLHYNSIQGDCNKTVKISEKPKIIPHM